MFRLALFWYEIAQNGRKCRTPKLSKITQFCGQTVQTCCGSHVWKPPRPLMYVGRGEIHPHFHSRWIRCRVWPQRPHGDDEVCLRRTHFIAGSNVTKTNFVHFYMRNINICQVRPSLSSSSAMFILYEDNADYSIIVLFTKIVAEATLQSKVMHDCKKHCSTFLQPYVFKLDDILLPH